MAPGLPDWPGRIGTAASAECSETIMKGWFSSMRITLKGYKLLAFLLVVAPLAVASFDNQNASGTVLTQTKNAESDRLFWLDNYQAAIKESKATGKPIFLEFRCGP
jgi:hypothetical protein